VALLDFRLSSSTVAGNKDVTIKLLLLNMYLSKAQVKF